MLAARLQGCHRLQLALVALRGALVALRGDLLPSLVVLLGDRRPLLRSLVALQEARPVLPALAVRQGARLVLPALEVRQGALLRLLARVVRQGAHLLLLKLSQQGRRRRTCLQQLEAPMVMLRLLLPLLQHRTLLPLQPLQHRLRRWQGQPRYNQATQHLSGGSCRGGSPRLMRP